MLCDQIGQIDERRARLQGSSEDEDLRAVVLNVIVDLLKTMGRGERVLVNLSLSRRSPVDVRLPVDDDKVESEDYDERDQRRDPVDEEHDRHAGHEAEQAQPNVVILKRNR